MVRRRSIALQCAVVRTFDADKREKTRQVSHKEKIKIGRKKKKKTTKTLTGLEDGMSGEAKETRGEEGEVAIQEGDSVVLYGSRTRATVVPRVERGAVTHCEFGVFPHDSLIGRAFGSRVTAAPRRDGKPSGGWVWALRLTSELWSRFLPHRTQVLYSADIAMVVFNLGLAPGCVVVESGTGSGSLTFALAQAVGAEGRVYTFDFHEQRAKEARAAFERLGGRNVVVSQADACSDGFLAPVDGADLRGKVDGVFLDLPSPWDAVKHADAVLKPGGMFCAFSPCIEQVQRTCLELVADSKFHSLSKDYKKERNRKRGRWGNNDNNTINSGQDHRVLGARL